MRTKVPSLRNCWTRWLDESGTKTLCALRQVGATRPERAHERAVSTELLDAVVPRVRDDDVAATVHTYTERTVELTCLGSLASERAQNCRAVACKHLNSVILSVRHKNVIIAIHTHTMRRIKLSRRSTVTFERMHG
eukprot:gnl/Spiro4/21700_TR10625_c0_g1_i1.p2 gnl/Spiro4/21700_TR10625_c0_g1~~gnl/Spiro4/21700_TR10625_c0_g1_i1.p2  ORF type:complete len:136 (+),score=3.15 gnl/Spiro4/21700_TR10625_c0_g1_i1:65-472(+)